MPVLRKAAFIVPACVLVVFAMFTSGCGTDDPFRLEDETANLKVIHTSPNAGQIDVYWDNSLLLEGVAYRNASGYLETTSGRHLFQVTPLDSQTVVLETPFDMLIDTSYTIVVTGLAGQLSTLRLIDDRESVPERTRVRFVHVSPDAPAVDVAVTGGDVLWSNVSYHTATEYVELPGGVYDLEVREAGTTTVVLPLPNTQLFGSLNYSLYAIGEVGAGNLSALSVRDTQ